MAAALAQPADHLLVGQHGAQGGTPIDRGLDLVGQAMLVAIAVDGLGPLLGDFVGDGQLGDRPALCCWASNQVSKSTRKMNCVQRK